MRRPQALPRAVGQYRAGARVPPATRSKNHDAKSNRHRSRRAARPRHTPPTVRNGSSSAPARRAVQIPGASECGGREDLPLAQEGASQRLRPRGRQCRRATRRPTAHARSHPPATRVTTHTAETPSRTYDTGLTVEDPAHLEGLLAATRQANVHTTRDRLRAAVPNTSTLFERLAERGEALRPHATRLLALLDDYGPQELAAAVDIALQRDALGAGSITHILETRRRQRGLKPPLHAARPARIA